LVWTGLGLIAGFNWITAWVWIVLDWIGLDRYGVDWIELDWVCLLDWIGYLDGFGLD